MLAIFTTFGLAYVSELGIQLRELDFPTKRMIRGPENLLPNSHHDWANVYKFDKFMAKNWVSSRHLIFE